MSKNQSFLLRQIRIGLGVMLMLSVACELFLFPSMENTLGCFMAMLSYWVFIYFLKERYILMFPFAFFLYLSMFMYRFLPLVATLLEGKPITFGFERPYDTFFYEIILFLISSLAFYLACSTFRGKRNNLVQKGLKQLHFFETTPAIIWGMGLVGLLIRLYNFNVNEVEYGDTAGKFLLGLDYLMYAPLCLFFPSLLQLKYDNKKILWIYGAIVFILNIASNSRRQIIIPIGIIILLCFIYLVSKNLKISNFLSPLKLLFLGIAMVGFLNILSNISLAMLYTRKIRSDIGKFELFEQTFETLKNKELMQGLKLEKEEEGEQVLSYHEGWTEYYLDNFMLARYANLRITDETLYYAEKKGYANNQMLQLFKDNVLALAPTPILKFFGIDIDKKNLEFSRGDYLYGSGFGGYRVTSHVADGLATFGFWYFPIQFLASFIIFLLLNSLVLYSSKALVYAPFALMNVFTFLGLFRNAQGIIADFGYIFRGFLQGIITYLIIYHLVKFLIWTIKPKYVIHKPLAT